MRFSLSGSGGKGVQSPSVERISAEPGIRVARPGWIVADGLKNGYSWCAPQQFGCESRSAAPKSFDFPANWG
jgi:hypothetical protein